ncbi:MAG: CoA pyrophosphatase [Polyangiales bacterium]
MERNGRCRGARAVSRLAAMQEMGPDEVEARLGARARVVRAGRGEVPAAVLVPLLRRDGAAHVMLTLRQAAMRRHGGQFAFPGGRRDEGDRDAVHTALREAHEEVGLDPAAVRVLGMLDDHSTSTGFVVTPVVGWIPSGLRYRLSEDEVAQVVELPLAAFSALPRARTVAAQGHRRIVLPFEVQGHLVWGATAAMLRELAARLAAR